MRVLIFHGWLLRGTGSNVYNASLASALARQGHEVHLVCQDREAPDLATDAPGTVTIHNPDIGGLLPVFVHDTYEGFEVKTFAELTDSELDRYLATNVAFVGELVDRLGGVDAALANHLVMAPVILGRAGLRYALKVHGSDLSYTILPELDRWRPFAEEAVAGANGILVGSGHIAERLRMAVDDPETNAKVRLGPPGVDTSLFTPIPAAERRPALTALARELRRTEPGPAGEGSSWDRDPGVAAGAVDWYAEGDAARVVFVGKTIVSKGLDLLVAAWPLVRAEHPGARLLVIGFGAAEEALGRVQEGLDAGELAPLHELARRGRGLEGGEEAPLSMLGAFLEAAPEEYVELARAAAGSVRFGGRLEHAEVAVVVDASDALVFPSTFPEAFGMVAAEAAAAGVLPVSANHSGAAEVSRELAADLEPDLRGLVAFDLDGGAVEAIADRLCRWLALGPAERASASAALRETVERLWSWDGVARSVLAAAAGDLAAIARPGAEVGR